MAATADLYDLAFREIRQGNLDGARASFQQAREQVAREGWSGLLPSICVVGAALVSAEGDHRHAAILVGVAHTAFLDAGQLPDPGEVVAIATTSEAAVTALGAEGFAAEFSRGRQSGPSSIVFAI
jgi:hypothetical protein